MSYTLYIANNTCSQAAMIIAHEVGEKVTIRHVDVKTHLFKETNGKYDPANDYYKVNPKGYVSFLVLPTGETLSETLAVTTYLADLKPELKLVPAQGSFARYKALEDLTFVATEIHQKYIPVFREFVHEDAKQQFREILVHNFSAFDERLKDGRKYIYGDTFATLDAYVFAVYHWSFRTGVDLSNLTNLKAFIERVKERKSVKEALEEEKKNVGDIAPSV